MVELAGTFNAAEHLPSGKVKRYNRNALKLQMKQEVDTEEHKTPSIQPSKQFCFRHIKEVTDNIKPPDWLIEEIIEAGCLAVVYGDPGSYKSFWVIDLICSIGTGTPWNKHPVKRGPVIVFIGEGHSGYGRRIKAWVKATGRYISDAPIFISEKPVQMLDGKSAQEAATAIKELQEQHGKPVLVVFDTLNRNFGPGDENSTKDMTQFVAVLDEMIGNDIAKLLVHHTGHGDKTRGRGSSALKGAVDAEYQLEKNDIGVTLYCRKMKDAVEFSPMSFEPEIVTVGGTLDEPITSLYLKPSDHPVKKAEKLSPQMRQAISLLQKMGGEKCLRCLDDWKEICIEENVYTRTSFYRLVEKLETREIIRIKGTYVQLSPGVS